MGSEITKQNRNKQISIMGRFSQTVPSPHVRRGSTGLILVYYFP